MAKCDRTDCTNKGTTLPVLLVTDGTEAVAEAFIGVKVCDVHQAKVVAKDLISDEGWAVLSKAFELSYGRPPERAKTTLRWEPLDSPTAQSLGRKDLVN